MWFYVVIHTPQLQTRAP